VEDILAIIFIFGGGTAVLMSFSPLGKALAERIRHGKQPLPPVDPDPALYDELDRVRLELNEIHERLDFAERLLTEGRGQGEGS
jgi:hypothetical protein